MSHNLEHWIRQVRDHDPRVTITKRPEGDGLHWFVLGGRISDWPETLRRSYVTHSDVARSPTSPVPEMAPVVAVRSRTTATTAADEGWPWWVVVAGVLVVAGGVYLLARRGS